MALASPVRAGAEGNEGSLPVVALVPRFGDPAHAGMDEETTAWWALDISGVRELIASVVLGARPETLVQDFIAGITVCDVDQNAVHLVGSYAGRRGMIGKPVAAYWPPEGWPVLVDLIMAATMNFPPGAARSREMTSIAFEDAKVNCSTELAYPDVVFLSVGGKVVDERSFWVLRASEERYRNLLHHLSVALLQVDAREIGRVYQNLKQSGVGEFEPYVAKHPELVDAANATVMVTEANMSAAHLFGAKTPEDLIGPVGYIFSASPETARRVMQARFEGRRSLFETMKMRRFDGSLIDVEITVTYPRPPERLDVTLISLVDISDRIQTEAQLRQLQADYARAARISMLGELATSIAHEVNQPLSAIVTNAETSMRWLARDEPNLAKVGQLVSRIAGSARHASEIVQRIRAMAAKHMPERSPLDLNDVVHEALVFVRHDLETRSIALSLGLEADLAPALGDRVQLQQVIVNLLLNAIQAIAQGGTPIGQIDVSTATDGDGAVAFTIRDCGPGINPANLDHIFESFFTTKDDGIGIGLAVCQSIIAAHGGALSATNHAEGGAVFRFSIPSPEKP